MQNLKKMVVGSNWKIFMRSRNEAEEYIQILRKNMKSVNHEIIESYILPDFGCLETVKNNLENYPVHLGAQDVFWEDYGPYTGEMSPLLLKEIGCRFVMVGHSERRLYFCENDDTSNKKVLACYRNGLVPLLLIGETINEREKGNTSNVLKKQLKVCLNGIPKDFMSELVIIYEPRWAIGQKDAASPSIIDECHKLIRQFIMELYDKNTSDITRVIYGGSLNIENSKEILSIPDVDGLAITRASLDPLAFKRFIQLVESEATNRLNQIR